ncbi:polysaccharide deacetylase family protein [Actinoplanes solisilvae]|uniref:polysaccharide deacetylase family protein n=1 Tax=Actinoplanes solisilvae TaxID=2486853 RepID=UPI001F0C06AF|nr:polysaccharide deacetylase family protein [Actinoplanes solisilvae]
MTSLVDAHAATSSAATSRPTRSARHQRPANGPRHAARVPAQRRPRNARPAATGSHRAPGTLPIESWLLMGKKRQQVLLASLVAIGIVLLAMPSQQRRDGIDAVNAAAQAVVGVQAGKKTPQAAPPPQSSDRDETTPVKDEAPAKVEPTPTATATKAPPPVQPSKAPADKKENPAGPGQSLRTTGSEVVALTFDDGPDPVQTPRILELLAKYRVKAVFCLVGAQVKRHPDIVRQIVAQGHTLCNHTWDHSLTIGKDKPAKIKADLDRTNAEILAAEPNATIPFFRAPGGNFTDRLVGVAASSAMTSLYWEVDPRDWEHPEKETDAQHVERLIVDVRKQVRPGSIVLSHDFNQPTTIAAYEKLLPWLAANFKLGIPGEASSGPTPSTPPSAPADT